MRAAGIALAIGVAGGLAYAMLAAQTSPRAAGLAIGGLGASAAVMAEPALGYLLSAAMIPVERFGRLTDDTSTYTLSVMRMLGLVALASLLLHALVRRRMLVFGRAFWLYALYTALAFLSLTYSSDRTGTVRACGQILGNLAFFFVVVNLTRSFAVADLGMSLCLAVTVAIAGLTAYSWHYGEPAQAAREGTDDAFLAEDRWATSEIDIAESDPEIRGSRRAMGSTSHPAVYGVNLVLTVPFFLALTRRRRIPWPVRALVWLALLLVFYNLVLTNTRATLLIAGLMLLLSWAVGLLVVRPPAVLALAVAAASVIPFVKAESLGRVLDPGNYTPERSGSIRIRLIYYEAGLRVFQDNWLLGIGVGNKEEIPRYINEKVGKETSVHNEYLQSLMELGALGFPVYLAFFGLATANSFRAAARYRRAGGDDRVVGFLAAAQVAMLAALATGLQVDVFHFPLKGWWYIAGVTDALARSAPRRPGGPPGTEGPDRAE
jgi:hypothetical protein